MRAAGPTESTSFCALFLACAGLLHAQQLAFPTAEGYGKHTVGGRGGKVYEVTNLNSSGEGSFAAAVGASGPRTVVFRVSGTIEGGATVSNDNITIAGQTAPGDGIQLRGRLGIGADEVIIRYIRVRLDGGGDAIGAGKNHKNIILDHVSASWSTDEIISIYHNENVTIQWSMITEANSGSHKFGGIWGNNYSTYHHNLFAHNTDRNPRIASGAGYNDVRNNVIYNWENESVYGCEVHQPGGGGVTGCWTNVVANYYKPGPGTPAENATRIVSPWSRDGAADYGKWYVADNHVVGHPEVTADNWLGVFPQYTGQIDDDRAAIPGLKLNEPAEFMPINQQTPQTAYEAVLKYAGCSLPNRDSHDARIVEEVRTGTATHGDGFVSSPTELPDLKSAPAPPDGDHDGMPDEWEVANGLNPGDAGDGGKTGKDGYTNLENYLNSLVPPHVVASAGEKPRDAYGLAHRRPDPFNPSPRFRFSLPTQSRVKLEVFDMAGKSMGILVDGIKPAGNHEMDFDAIHLKSGLYVYRFTTPRHTFSRTTYLIN